MTARQQQGTAFRSSPNIPQQSVGSCPVPTASKCIAGIAGLPSSSTRKARFCGPLVMELAGLEPATSWVRFRRSLRRDSARLAASRAYVSAPPTPSPTLCTPLPLEQHLPIRARTPSLCSPWSGCTPRFVGREYPAVESWRGEGCCAAADSETKGRGPMGAGPSRDVPGRERSADRGAPATKQL
jgi:hypothetical protein